MSGLIQGFAGYEQGKADAAMYKANAALAEQQAITERQQAGAAEELQRRQARKLLGKQAAAMAESGTGFSGSNLDVARQSAVEAELDALNIRYEGELRARGALAEAQQFRAQAKNAKRQGKLALAAGVLGTAETAYSMGGMGGGG